MSGWGAAPSRVKDDRRRCKRRHRIEIIVARLKDWLRGATRHDRCPEASLSAIPLAATGLSRL